MACEEQHTEASHGGCLVCGQHISHRHEYGQTDKQTNRKGGQSTGRQTDRQIRQAFSDVDRHRGRLTDRQIYISLTGNGLDPSERFTLGLDGPSYSPCASTCIQIKRTPSHLLPAGLTSASLFPTLSFLKERPFYMLTASASNVVLVILQNDLLLVQ